MTHLKKDTRLRMQRFYPKALELALAHYRRIAHRPEDDYPDFKKQQEACKVSIGHIQLLLKLGQDLIHEAKEGVDDADMIKLIENANSEIGDHGQ